MNTHCPFPPADLPAFPPAFPQILPPPIMDEQTLEYPVLHPTSLRVEWVSHYIAFGGQWHFQRRDLTPLLKRAKM